MFCLYILDALMVRRHVLVLLGGQLAYADWAEICPGQIGTLAFMSPDYKKNVAFRQAFIAFPSGGYMKRDEDGGPKLGIRLNLPSSPSPSHCRI
jgi:hypothetical protein